MRVLLPGLALVPEDYGPMLRGMEGPTAMLDTLAVPVTAGPAALRAELGTGAGPCELIGHSIGALAALEWALTAPHEVTRLVLLDPSDPFEPPVPAALGSVPGAVLRAVVAATATVPPLARRMGRAGRAALLGQYGVDHDLLDRARIDALYGRRRALGAVARQLTDVPSAARRVRALLGDGRLDLPVVVIGSGGDRAADDPAAAVAGRLGLEAARIEAGHLFPLTHPARTAELVAQAGSDGAAGLGHQ